MAGLMPVRLAVADVLVAGALAGAGVCAESVMALPLS